jgi:uncharacterized SAM-binding protein YcdF (DUF218 family)
VFFVAAKVLTFFVLPSNIIFILLVAGVVMLFTRHAKIGRRCVALATLCLLVVGLLPVGLALEAKLENRFPAWDDTRGAPTGFIILGGAISPSVSAKRGTAALDASAERITIVAELARKYPEAKFIYSGGNGGLLGGLPEADYVMPLFESFGIAKNRVLLERQSRTTAENATYSKILAAPKPGERWVVITSGIHMPRAIGTFRAAGFDVGAYPVDWQIGGEVVGFGLPPSLVPGLDALDAAAREFVGLLAYWLSGRSSELFPAPR